MRIARPPSVPTELTGRRIGLRPLAPGDYDAWSEVRRRCRDWLVRWEPWTPGRAEANETRPAFAARCSARDREWQLGTGYGFGIFVAAAPPAGRAEAGATWLHSGDRPSVFAGEINLSSVQRGPYQNAYVGYWIDEARAGQNYMPEALVCVARFAFEDLRLHRIQVSVIPRNRASRRVAEKVGMRDEGIARRYLQIAGVWEDHVRYALTAEDWDDRRHELLGRWTV